jgi:hypothetical protein
MQKISSALVQAQKAFGPALKTSTNPHFRSKYADLSACIEAVIDGLNASGIMLMQQSHECADGVIVETIFIHESGEQLSAGKLHVPATKHDAQGYGSAMTYARRYSLMAACGIAPEDDDANAASKKKTSPVPIISAVSSGDDLKKKMQPVANAAIEKFMADDVIGAFEECQCVTDSDEKVALWSLLPANLRAAVKKHGQQIKEAA